MNIEKTEIVEYLEGLQDYIKTLRIILANNHDAPQIRRVIAEEIQHMRLLITLCVKYKYRFVSMAENSKSLVKRILQTKLKN